MHDELLAEARARPDAGPLLVWPHEYFGTAKEAFEFARQVSGSLGELKAQRRVKHLHVYTTLPVHVLAVVAAMSGHALPAEVTFWESKADGSGEYVACPGRLS